MRFVQEVRSEEKCNMVYSNEQLKLFLMKEEAIGYSAVCCEEAWLKSDVD